jgi:hypothetical protein
MLLPVVGQPANCAPVLGRSPLHVIYSGGCVGAGSHGLLSDGRAGVAARVGGVAGGKDMVVTVP